MKLTMVGRFAAFALLLCVAAIPARAEKVAIWKYHTTEPFDKVYAETLQDVSLIRFIVRETNKDQGTINANLMAWGGIGGEYGALFIVISKETGGVCVKATFTRHSGSIGTGPHRWATQLGNRLREAFPDLVMELVTEQSPKARG